MPGTNKDKIIKRSSNGFNLKKLIKNIFRVVFISLLSLLSLILLLIILLQFKFFRSFIIHTLLNEVNKELIAKIELGDIYLNPFKGIELTEFRLLTQGDTLVYIPQLFLSIDVVSTLNNKIIIKSAEINDPIIKILRNNGGNWNYDYIAKPSLDTIPPAPIDLDIIIKHFRINNARFAFIDSLESNKKKAGDFTIYFNFKGIHFLSDAIIELKDMKFFFDIKLLKFFEEFSDFQLEELSGKIGFDNDYFTLSNLKLLFEQSDLTINLYSKYPWTLFTNNPSVNQSSNYSIYLKSKCLSSKDISKVYDLSKFFNGNIQLNLLAIGNKNNVNIEEFNISTQLSKINFSGQIKNFDNLEQIQYLVKIEDSYLNPSDLINSLPTFSKLELPFRRKVDIKSLNIDGSIDALKVDAKFETELGNLNSNINIHSINNQKYSAKLTLSNFNPSIFNINNSIINLNAELIGKGFEINNLDAILNIHISNSHINNILVNKGLISGNIKENGLINLDTSYIIFDSSMVTIKDINQEESSKLTLNGFFDIRDLNKPKYKANISAIGINTAKIANDNAMPISLTGNFIIEGTGFIPDSIDARLDVDISEAFFIDKALFPFNFSINLSRKDTVLRFISINSDFLNLKLTGNFNFSNIISLLDNQGMYLSNYINKKINSINPLNQDSQQIEDLIPKIEHFAPLDFTLRAEINNLYLLAPFIKDAKLDAQAKIIMKLNVQEDSSILTIDTANLNYLEYDNGISKITVNPAIISGNLLMLIKDSLPYLNNFDLNAQSNYEIKVNENAIQNPKIVLKLHDDYLDFKLNSRINNIIDFYTIGNLFFDTTTLDFHFDSLFLNYNDILSWSNIAPIEGYLNTEGINIQKFNISRKEAENISICGNIDDRAIDSLKIEIKAFPIDNLNKFISRTRIPEIESFHCKLDSLGILINGPWDSLKIDLGLRTNTLNWNNIKIGNLLGKLSFQDNYINGTLSLMNFENGIFNNYFNAQILSFPLNIFPKNNNKEIFYAEKPLKINIFSNNLPINYISSFVREVDNIKGSADIKLEILGFLPDKLNINGKLNIDPTSFLLKLNNLNYSIQGDISINKDSIKVNQINLFNNPKDLEDGRVSIKGNISIKDFNPELYYITMESSGFKILSDASIKTMPELYGNVIISTGPNPIRIFSNSGTPTIDGDINVIKANLNMPNTIAKQSLQSNIIYRINGNNLKLEYQNSLNKQENNNSNNEVSTDDENKEFASSSSKVEIDLGIRIPNNIKLKMELGSIEELNAEITVPDKTTPLRFYIPRGSTQPKMTGELLVREGSKLKIYKTFNTSGKISFPTGQIDNPTLDLKAEYFGKNTINNKIREFQVILTVNGTKSYPIINFNYIIDGKPAIGDSSTITQDAIFLLIFGKTKSELFASEGLNTSDFTGDISRTGLSMYFSKFLSDLLGSSGFIQDTDIDFSSGSWENATVKVSGQLGGATWRIGGNVTDFYYNNEFSIEFPLPLILHPKFLNNIILQFTRSTNTASPTTKDQKEWEVRLKFGGSW